MGLFLFFINYYVFVLLFHVIHCITIYILILKLLFRTIRLYYNDNIIYLLRKVLDVMYNKYIILCLQNLLPCISSALNKTIKCNIILSIAMYIVFSLFTNNTNNLV